MRDLVADADRLRALHVPGAPLLLANAWDPPTARLVEELGLAAVATSSGAVAVTAGYADGGHLPPDVAFAAVARVAAAVELPVSADLEDGYGLGADELVERLLEAGACGCNLEDTDHRAGGGLVDAARQADWLAQVKQAGRAAGVDLVLNARVDVHLLADHLPGEHLLGGPTGDAPDGQPGGGAPDGGRHDEARRRARRYRDAGADCVYPIGLADVEVTRALAQEVGPINALYRPSSHRLEAPTLAELTGARVSRISLGSGLLRVALARVRAAVQALQAGDDAQVWEGVGG